MNSKCIDSIPVCFKACFNSMYQNIAVKSTFGPNTIAFPSFSDQVNSLSVKQKERKYILHNTQYMSTFYPSGDMYLSISPSTHKRLQCRCYWSRRRVHVTHCQGFLLVTGRVLASVSCVYLWKGDPHHNHLLGHICGLKQAAIQQQYGVGFLTTDCGTGTSLTNSGEIVGKQDREEITNSQKK